MNDIIIKTEGGSVIQHGKFNDRVYLMKASENDSADLPKLLETLAADNGYGKIFARVPGWMAPEFIVRNFITEAFIPRFIRGSGDVFYMSKFLSSKRFSNITSEKEKLEALSAILHKAQTGKNQNVQTTDYALTPATHADADDIANLFRTVFDTYPFPINDPGYIRDTINGGTRYFIIREETGDIIAVSSAEIDNDYLSAEMTDFAVSPTHRGKRLSIVLLSKMENEMKRAGIKMLYTIARLNSIPMNRCFLRLGYTYSGTAVMNTNIAGRIESMNILYKELK